MNLTIRFDGGAAPNPGMGSCAYAIVRDSGKAVATSKWCMDGVRTNNEAEWEAVTHAVEEVYRTYRRGLQKLTIMGDSELVIRQIAGEYRVKNHKLRPYYQRIKRILDLLECPVETRHITRDLNQEMDDLCREARETI